MELASQIELLAFLLPYAGSYCRLQFELTDFKNYNALYNLCWKGNKSTTEHSVDEFALWLAVKK